MAILLGLKGKKAGGMGAVKFPGKKSKASKKTTAKKAKASGGKGRAPKPSLWGKREKKYAWKASKGAIIARIAKYRQKHNSLAKGTKPALKPSVRLYAKKYFKATRRDPKMKLYDKVRGKNYREFLKKKFGKTNTSMYNEGFRAGRRPRKGSKTRTYSSAKKAGKKRGRPAAKKTAAKKTSKKTTGKKRGRPAKKK